MKRTLTAITAAIFAGALAIPALAQVGVSGDADINSSSSSSVNESTRHEYRAAEPAPMANSVERRESEFHSERTEEAEPVPPPEVHHDVERRTTTRTTTTGVAPAPVVERRSTTRHAETESRDSGRRDHGVGANVGANVGPLGAHVGAGVGSTDSGY